MADGGSCASSAFPAISGDGEGGDKNKHKVISKLVNDDDGGGGYGKS